MVMREETLQSSLGNQVQQPTDVKHSEQLLLSRPGQQVGV